MLELNGGKYLVSELWGEWGSEGDVKEEGLEFGKKRIDRKLGGGGNMLWCGLLEVGLEGK